MADLSALSTANISVINPMDAKIITMIAAEAVDIGQAVYQNSSGKAALADANAAGAQQIRGIALENVAAGQAVSVLVKGILYGLDLSGMAYDAVAYLSDTAGALADAAGTMTVNVGRVVGLPDDSISKALFINIDWLRTWS